MEVNKTYFFLLFFYFIFYNQNAVNAQNKACSDISFEIEKILKEDKEYFKCENFTLEFKNPKVEHGKEKKENYHEGCFYRIIYSDSSCIFIHYGFMIKRPFLTGKNFTETKNIKSDNKISRIGYNQFKNTFWREDFYPNFNATIGYYNVKEKELLPFDKSLLKAVLSK